LTGLGRPRANGMAPANCWPLSTPKPK